MITLANEEEQACSTARSTVPGPSWRAYPKASGDREEHLHGYGHYHEEYRRMGDHWLISYRNLSRLREDRTPGFYDFLE
ncbi:hypothetical protein [Actinomadura sp. 6N118]|uniref:hypothetical protein n=1 Tax=Actinomadura sp. 6N118 TaxID=3375151 RepID=UPI0037BCAC95